MGILPPALCRGAGLTGRRRVLGELSVFDQHVEQVDVLERPMGAVQFVVFDIEVPFQCLDLVPRDRREGVVEHVAESRRVDAHLNLGYPTEVRIGLGGVLTGEQGGETLEIGNQVAGELRIAVRERVARVFTKNASAFERDRIAMIGVGIANDDQMIHGGADSALRSILPHIDCIAECHAGLERRRRGGGDGGEQHGDDTVRGGPLTAVFAATLAPSVDLFMAPTWYIAAMRGGDSGCLVAGRGATAGGCPGAVAPEQPRRVGREDGSGEDGVADQRWDGARGYGRCSGRASWLTTSEAERFFGMPLFRSTKGDAL